MLALGIDPGTAICGYGLVETKGSRIIWRGHGAITTSSKARPEDRLLKIYDDLSDIIARTNPDVMGIEQLFFNRNTTTAIPVGQARGVVLLAAAKNSLAIIEQTPLQVKQAVTGYGKADKGQVTDMVKKLLALKDTPKPDDAADALAIAISAAYLAESPAWRNRLT